MPILTAPLWNGSHHISSYEICLVSAQFVAHFFAKKGARQRRLRAEAQFDGCFLHTLKRSASSVALWFLSGKWEKLFLEIDGDSNYINTIWVETGANLETTWSNTLALSWSVLIFLDMSCVLLLFGKSSQTHLKHIKPHTRLVLSCCGFNLQLGWNINDGATVLGFC